MTTFHLLNHFNAFGLLNLSATQSIAKELTVFTSIHFLANTSAKAIVLILIANIHILSALHLSMFICSISAHLIKFQAQTTIQTSIFFLTNHLTVSQTSSSIT
jgi:hypothetical protein